MKSAYIGCLAVFFTGCVWGQELSDFPYPARQALDKMEAAVILAKKRAVADLTAVMASETRSGKMKAAALLDTKIKELSAEIDALENKGAPGKGTDFLPGKWRMGNGVIFLFDKANTFSAAGGNFKWSGTWKVDGRKLLVNSAVFVDAYDLPPQKSARGGQSAWSLKGTNSKGEPVYLDKLE